MTEFARVASEQGPWNSGAFLALGSVAGVGDFVALTSETQS